MMSFDRASNHVFDRHDNGAYGAYNAHGAYGAYNASSGHDAPKILAVGSVGVGHIVGHADVPVWRFAETPWLLRVDLNDPSVQAELKRQMNLIATSPQAEDEMAWIDEAFEEVMALEAPYDAR
ncbi:MAG: DUF3018 family protein [Candidatus Symbiobacter sp.]|nr:DUF3018 family protein [Candidatus Symbiobacter sp.]